MKPSRLAISLSLSLLSISCTGGGAPAGLAEHAAALNQASDFWIPPVVVPNNNHHIGQEDGFSVFWEQSSTLTSGQDTSVPSFQITGGTTPPTAVCSSDGFTIGCGPRGTQPYCRCSMINVQPNTTYNYSVTYNHGNSIYTGTTKTRLPPSAPDNFSFVFYADSHGIGHLTMEQVASAMKTENPAFGINGGDVGEDGRPFASSPSLTLTPIEASYNAEQLDGFRSTVPVFVAVGNHDWWGEQTVAPYVEQNAGWPRILLLQGGDPLGPRPDYGTFASDPSVLTSMGGWQYRYYSFDWGNSHFLVLDTGIHSRFDVGGTWLQGETWLGGNYDLDVDQLNFAMNDLIAASQNPDIQHKFVIMHTPMFDTKGDVEELIANADAPMVDPDHPDKTVHPILEWAFERFGVDMVLAGHRHHYEHLTKHNVDYVTCSGSSNYDTSKSGTYDWTNSTQAATAKIEVNHGGYCLINVLGEGFNLTRKDVAATDSNGTQSFTFPINNDFFERGQSSPSNPSLTVVTPFPFEKIQVSWTDNSKSEIEYIVERSTDPGFSTSAIMPAVNDGHSGHTRGTLSFTDYTPSLDLMAPGTTVYYRVKGHWFVNGADVFSDPSPAVSTTINTCKVTNLVANADAGAPNVLLSWFDPNCSGLPVDHYQIQRKGCNGSILTGCFPSFYSDIATSTQPFAWDLTTTCALMTYRVRAVYASPFIPTSDWSDPVAVDGTAAGKNFPCGAGGLKALAVSPSEVKAFWANDWTGGNTEMESSTDGINFTQYVTTGTSAITQYDYSVQSSCSGTTPTYSLKVADYDKRGGSFYYGPTVTAQPSLCLATPRLTAAPGGGRVKLAVDYPNPVPGVPTPDVFVLERRVHGELGFGMGRRFAFPAQAVVDDRDVSCGAAYEYRVRGFYSSATGGFWPAGAGSELSETVSVTPSCGECANGAAPAQIFSPGMLGCGGAVTWDQRGSVCALGYAPCTAAEWNANRGGTAPTNDYWTDDNLTYSGSSSACQANTSGGTSCGTDRPMRVCRSGTDSYGNTCTWTGCGLNTTTNQYFGGCVANPTAGALCCKRSAACADSVVNTQAFAPGVVGCGGLVPWGARNTLCAAECRACTAAEYHTYRSGMVPTHDYWTDDNLGFSGSSTACAASLSGTSCGGTTPMRVCTPSGSDSEGNFCNWTGCGLNANSPNDYFGGCAGNQTAGTLCCCDR